MAGLSLQLLVQQTAVHGGGRALLLMVKLVRHTRLLLLLLHAVGALGPERGTRSARGPLAPAAPRQLFPVASLLLQLFLNLVDLLCQKVIVLVVRVGRLVHVALHFARVRHQALQALVQHVMRVGGGENCLKRKSWLQLNKFSKVIFLYFLSFHITKNLQILTVKQKIFIENKMK